MKRHLDLFTVVNVIILSLVAAASLGPFLYMIAVSLSSQEYVLRNEVVLWPKGFNFEMYEYVLQNKQIWTGYKNTIIYTVAGTLFSLVVSAMGAYALSKKEMIFSKFFTLMVVFTMLFSGGMIPTFLVVKNLGIMNTMWAMLIPGLISTWNLIIMRTFYQGIPKELEESAKIDGLNDLGVFMKIIIPLSKSVLAAIGLFYAVGIWNNFYHALLYLRNDSLFPLQIILRNLVLAGGFQDGNLVGGGDGELVVDESLKFATILVSTLPIIMVYPFLQKYFVKGVLIGSVKG